METLAGRVFVYGGGIVASFAAGKQNHVEVVLPQPEIKVTPHSLKPRGAGCSKGEIVPSQTAPRDGFRPPESCSRPAVAASDQLINGDALRAHHA
jgi:hypothetical protein